MRIAAIARSLCLVSLASVGGLPAEGQSRPEQLESEVRAVFLLRMAQFADWPASSATGSAEPFEFCVVQDEAFRSLLESAVRNERIDGRPAIVLGVPATAPEGSCDLLYIPAALRESAPRILARLPRSPTLTVAGYEGFLRQGGAIEMYVDRSNIRFRINRRAAESAGLSLRSQLLRAAAAVTED